MIYITCNNGKRKQIHTNILHMCLNKSSKDSCSIKFQPKGEIHLSYNGNYFGFQRACCVPHINWNIGNYI